MSKEERREAQPDESFLHSCMYFTSNRLSRAMARIADDAFATTGLAPAYGYLIRLVVGRPGISQKELAEKLYITPSTLTRFVDKLESKQLLRRSVQGKMVHVFPTEKAEALVPVLREASRNLKLAYEDLLGRELANKLTAEIDEAGRALE